MITTSLDLGYYIDPNPMNQCESHGHWKVAWLASVHLQEPKGVNVAFSGPGPHAFR